MSIEDMAKAHLGTVRQAIQELQVQKDNAEKEIAKLTDYLLKCEAELNSASESKE
tara:strand:+ start:241 stop:405 length:165 start_codon:yes stop_codon:yes gene_type:complete